MSKHADYSPAHVHDVRNETVEFDDFTEELKRGIISLGQKSSEMPFKVGRGFRNAFLKLDELSNESEYTFSGADPKGIAHEFERVFQTEDVFTVTLTLREQKQFLLTAERGHPEVDSIVFSDNSNQLRFAQNAAEDIIEWLPPYDSNRPSCRGTYSNGLKIGFCRRHGNVRLYSNGLQSSKPWISSHLLNKMVSVWQSLR